MAAMSTGIARMKVAQRGAAALWLQKEGAHGECEKRTGQHDANWPDWYAAYMVAEQAGEERSQ